MNEAVLKDYFNGEISTDILFLDVEDSEVKISYDVTRRTCKSNERY